MNELIIKLESYLHHVDVLNEKISKSSVGWHLMHSLLVLNGIIEATKSSNPSNYSSKFNLARTVILRLKKIPRGKGKSPESVKPIGEITPEKILNQLDKVKISFEALVGLHKNHHFLHPYFGNLNLKRTEKFIKIHTNHHLKIIRDILNK